MKVSLKTKYVAGVMAMLFFTGVFIGLFCIIGSNRAIKSKLIEQQELLIESFTIAVQDYIEFYKNVITFTGNSEQVRDTSEFGLIKERIQGAV